MKTLYKILLLGPQGSGKGTQAELLSKTLKIPALSMGQLLRDEIAKESAIGKEITSILKEGNLVSDEVAAQVLQKRLEQEDAKRGYVLDGYPRNMSQYAAFDFDEPTHVIVLELPQAESLKRLGGRLTCLACGRVASTYDGVAVGDPCPCGKGVYTQRDDDTPEAIQRRLDIYEEETKPVVRTYEEKQILHRVDALGSIQEVHERILHVLEQ